MQVTMLLISKLQTTIYLLLNVTYALLILRKTKQKRQTKILSRQRSSFIKIYLYYAHSEHGLTIK